MKKYILVLLAILVASCFHSDRKKFIYTVQNISSKPIKIKAINQDHPNTLPNIINLDVGQKLTKFYEDDSPNTTYGFRQFFEGDKLIIIYNNEKYIIFTFGTFDDGNSNNPFNRSVYYRAEETYVVKDEYFTNAIPCDANCD